MIAAKDVLSVLFALCVPSVALAQPYGLAWHTVDGGGAMGGTGGTYGISGSIGQPDAGGPFAGGSYGLHGGFWALIAAGGTGAEADLGVTKTDGQATAVPGQAVLYTIVVTNAGPDAASAATVSDTPPASLGSVTWTCSASAGSSCPASGSGPIDHTVNVAANGTLAYSLTGTIDPAATGSLDNTATVTPPPGVSDPNLGNNSATDTDTLTPQADLSLAMSDSPDPVGSGAPLAYTIQVTNLGPSASSGMTVTDTLPPQLTFVSATPGSPTCTFASGTVTCDLGALAPAAVHTLTVHVTVNTGVLGPISNTAAVAGNETDPVPGNDSDTETTQVIVAAEGELIHGSILLGSLESVGGVPDEDLFRIRQQAHASYEVVVDATSGDIGSGQGPALDRLASDATTVLQSSVAAGAGSSRSLRWINTTAAIVDGEYVRVRSQGCTTSCVATDVYRIRAYETTYAGTRFNNSATQVTVVLVQNTSSQPVAGRLAFWSAAGALLVEQPFTLLPRALFSLNTASLAALQGQSGTMTMGHDGAYGALAGKAVAVEPATGFTFDTALAPRPLQ
jgi:uncharacterized repeat protein (TIGR01451 family)